MSEYTPVIESVRRRIQERNAARDAVINAARDLVRIEGEHLMQYIMGPRENRDGRTKIHKDLIRDFIQRRGVAGRALEQARVAL